ncbi:MULTISPECIES: hypothetical protein [Micrococcaceae]|nr:MULTISPECIES: hypothetical protein [Micrococcaceae]
MTITKGMERATSPRKAPLIGHLMAETIATTVVHAMFRRPLM